MPRQRSRFEATTVTAAMVLFFIVIVAGVLLAANGYVVNFRTLSIQQRAVISLNGLPAQATVSLDGQVVSQKLATTIRNILPGQHAVRISAPGLQGWDFGLRLSSGEAIVRDSIELFRVVPIEMTSALPTVPATSIVVNPTLSVSGGELTQLVGTQRKLITRFSQPVLAAQLSNDRAHVFVQLGNQIVVTELDGANTTPLVTLDTAAPVVLSPSAHDSILAIRNGTTVQAWQIR